MTKRIWIYRAFESGMPSEAIPDLIERLRGTPARLEERLGALPRQSLSATPDGGWSILKNVGHLLDLEPLWAGRLDDFETGATELRPADMSNAATENADHDARISADLLREFRNARERLVERLENLTPEVTSRTPLHPRLQQPMTLADLAFFAAEHDDHHLARITDIIREIQPD